MSTGADLQLTGILAVIAEIAGPTAALQLAHAKGGAKIYWPQPANLDGHWLVEVVGLEAARALCKRLGGGRDEIPLGLFGGRGRAWRIMREALAEGATVTEAARRAGVSSRTARRHKNGHAGPRTDGRQGSLF